MRALFTAAVAVAALFCAPARADIGRVWVSSNPAAIGPNTTLNSLTVSTLTVTSSGTINSPGSLNVKGGSVTASAFFGDGSHLSGIVGETNTWTSSKTFTSSVQVAKNGGTLLTGTTSNMLNGDSPDIMMAGTNARLEFADGGASTIANGIFSQASASVLDWAINTGPSAYPAGGAQYTQADAGMDMRYDIRPGASGLAFGIRAPASSTDAQSNMVWAINSVNDVFLVGTYAQSWYSGGGFTQPANGMLVSGSVGIGASSQPSSKLEVSGNGSFGYVGNAAPSNGLIVAGNVGVGTSAPGTAALFVAGASTFTGAAYFGIDIATQATAGAGANTIAQCFGTKTAISGACNCTGGVGITSQIGMYYPTQTNAHGALPTGWQCQGAGGTGESCITYVMCGNFGN